jgi:hypothetical protein
MMENRRGWRLTERANGGGEVGHEQGVLADRWMAPGRPETGGRGRRARCARGRPNRGGERLTGGSRPQCRAAALTDRRAPTGGGRGREEREARGAHGPARERRRWVEPR